MKADECNDCASYGSEFCEDCLEELAKRYPEEIRPTFNHTLHDLAKAIVNDKTMGGVDTPDSEA